jgi:hypothetical protein
MTQPYCQRCRRPVEGEAMQLPYTAIYGGTTPGSETVCQVCYVWPRTGPDLQARMDGTLRRPPRGFLDPHTGSPWEE